MPRLTGACNDYASHACLQQPAATHLQPRNKATLLRTTVFAERPAPTLHFRRRRLQVWLHRCCNQGVTGLTIQLPQPAGSASSWLTATSFSSECPYTHVPVTTAQHSGFRSLACKLRSQAWHDVACPQSQQPFFAGFAQRPGKAPLRRHRQRGHVAGMSADTLRTRLPTAPVNWQVSPSESRLAQGPASQTLFA